MHMPHGFMGAEFLTHSMKFCCSYADYQMYLSIIAILFLDLIAVIVYIQN